MAKRNYGTGSMYSAAVDAIDPRTKALERENTAAITQRFTPMSPAAGVFRPGPSVGPTASPRDTMVPAPPVQDQSASVSYPVAPVANPAVSGAVVTPPRTAVAPAARTPMVIGRTGMVLGTQNPDGSLSDTMPPTAIVRGAGALPQDMSNAVVAGGKTATRFSDQPVTMEEAKRKGLIFDPNAAQNEANAITNQQLAIAGNRNYLQRSADASMEMTSPAAQAMARQFNLNARTQGELARSGGPREWQRDPVRRQQLQARWDDAYENALTAAMPESKRTAYLANKSKNAMESLQARPDVYMQMQQGETAVKVAQAGAEKEKAKNAQDLVVEREKMANAKAIAEGKNPTLVALGRHIEQMRKDGIDDSVVAPLEEKYNILLGLEQTPAPAQQGKTIVPKQGRSYSQQDAKSLPSGTIYLGTDGKQHKRI